MVIPANATERLRATLGLGGGDPPVVEVYYNADDPVKRRFVESTIESRLADANTALSDAVLREAAQLHRRDRDAAARSRCRSSARSTSSACERSQGIIESVAAGLPRGLPAARRRSPRWRASPSWRPTTSTSPSRSSPRSARRCASSRRSSRRKTSLDSFAVAVAVTVSLMFVTLLLAAGMLALEREEHAFGRLVRGLVSRSRCWRRRSAWARCAALAVTLAMLVGLAVFVGLDWGRSPLWLAALALGALGFAALGVAIGGLAREVRAASLLAFLLSLPIAFLALVPSGSVDAGLYNVINVVSGLFPFKPALQALDAAINDGEPAGCPPLHLLGADRGLRGAGADRAAPLRLTLDLRSFHALLSRHPHAPPPPHRRPARPRARDLAVGRAT